MVNRSLRPVRPIRGRIKGTLRIHCDPMPRRRFDLEVTIHERALPLRRVFGITCPVSGARWTRTDPNPFALIRIV
ncbi:MAG TPA: hypothetical protein DEP84_07910 [Chloroflexi bacterium]|nr:hypothetical protein [Chloroflexota bacterium]